jgi:hypothetical protein
MKMYGCVEGIAPRILNFDTMWMWVLAFMPRSPDPLDGPPPLDSHWVKLDVSPNVGLDNAIIITALQPLLGLDRFFFFSFLTLYRVGRTPWTGDQPVARPLLTNRINAHRHIHASSRFRTHVPSVWESEDSSCLRPCGHCDRRLVNEDKTNPFPVQGLNIWSDVRLVCRLVVIPTELFSAENATAKRRYRTTKQV